MPYQIALTLELPQDGQTPRSGSGSGEVISAD